MRKLIVALFVCLFSFTTELSYGQYNKAYFFWMGRNMLLENQYREAIRTLGVLLMVDDEAYEAYFLRGVAKYNLDDFLGAEQDFSRAIEYNPVYTMAYHYRAITRMRLGNYDDALADFQEAIDLRPDLPGPYYSRGVTLLLSGQYQRAAEDFSRFIRYNNRVADAYINRGTSYLHMGDTLRAVSDYDQAIRVNRENPDGYNRRGAVLMAQGKTREALADFDQAVACDSTYVPSFFNRAIAYSALDRPTQAIRDFDRVIELDSLSAVAYFNRAIIRSQIGDLNRALEDYNQVARYAPDNVLVYFNRALLYSQLGEPEAAVADYTKAIELYPDFASAYLNRAELKQLLRDTKGAKQDLHTAQRKIAEYRSRLEDTTQLASYADTSKRFDRLLSFDTRFAGARLGGTTEESRITLRPLFRFTLRNPTAPTGESTPVRYYADRLEEFIRSLNDPRIVFTTETSDLPTDSIFAIDKRLTARIDEGNVTWSLLFRKGITQSLIRQFTSAVNSFTKAIENDPTNPFLYINRSTTRAEMIDFISSIDNSYQRIAIESDPANRLRSTSTRTYNYDEAIADLNAAAKLYPDLAYIYYNRGNLNALSGKFPEAFDDYSRAIELNPVFAEAYYNRGLVQIYMKDTRKGCLDVSKAGELGIREAYEVLNRYAPTPE